MRHNRTFILFLIIAAFTPFSGQLFAQIQPNANNIVFVNKNAQPGGNGQTWATAVKELADVLKWAREQTDNNQASWSEADPLSVWVAEGIYKPLYRPEDGMYTQIGQGKPGAFVLVRNVRLFGGFKGNETSLDQRDWQANKTNLSGDYGDNDEVSGFGTGLTIAGNGDNAYHTIVAAGSLGSAILDGFVVSGGSADFTPNQEPPNQTVNLQSIYPNSGGGMFCINTNVTVSNCEFSGNYATFAGGGVYAMNSQLNFSNCTIRQNRAPGTYGGGLYISSTQAQQFTNCLFWGNASRSGGGVSVLDNSPVNLSGCTFMSNSAQYGGGLYVVPATVTISAGKFIGNNASIEGGAFYNQDAHPQIVNSEFTGNYAGQKGGGIFSKGGVPSIINCTIAGNNAAEGGGIYGDGVTGGIVKNSMVWNNSSGTGGSTFSFEYSLAQELPAAGTGNLDGTIAYGSVFASPVAYSSAPTTNGNYHLSSVSPAINTGSNGNIPPGVSTDGDNYPRIENGTVDMGAYEYNRGMYRGHALYVDAAASPGGDGSNWGRAFKTLTEALTIARAYQDVTIFVAGGTYYPTTGTDRDRTFLLPPRNVRLFGGYDPAAGVRNPAGTPAVLSGDIGNPGREDNSYHVMVIPAPESDSTIVDGFTITGGSAEGDGSNAFFYQEVPLGTYRSWGGGVYLANVSNNGKVVLRNCIISGNSATDFGGGVINANTSLVAVNSLFSGNRAKFGGGLCNVPGSDGGVKSIVHQSTFAGNFAVTRGGGIDNFANVELEYINTLVYGNNSGVGGNAATYSGRNSLIQGLAGGGYDDPDGNLDGTVAYAAMFVGEVASHLAPNTLGDYRPVESSPARDNGSDAYATGITTDLTFTPRIFGPQVDIGAYEFSCPGNALAGGGQAWHVTPGNEWFNPIGDICYQVGGIRGGGPGGIEGSVYVRAWAVNEGVIADGPARFVRRYYSVSTPSEGWASLKFYYSNADFKAYNEAYGNSNNARLPDKDDENPDISNLKIFKYSGISFGNQLPGDYLGSTIPIFPTEVVWEEENNRWRVVFTTLGFSGFFITGQSLEALPVTLLSFKAEKQENTAQLTWQTTEEKDFSHFDIERSVDARNWQGIGRVKGRAVSGDTDYEDKSTSGSVYRFTDSRPGPGIVFYRLKMVDLDGTFSYSPIESISFGEGSALANAYPNPSQRGMIKLDVKGITPINIKVYDLSGRQVNVSARSMEAGAYELDFSRAAPGVYSIIISHESGVTVRKQVVY